MGAAVLHPVRQSHFAVLTFGMTELIRHAITHREKQVTGTVGARAQRGARARHHLPHRARAGGAGHPVSILVAQPLRSGDVGALVPTSSADAGRRHAPVKIAGFALTAAFAGAAGGDERAPTYIDPATVFNPFIGFQTVLIAAGSAARPRWVGPLIAAVVQPAGRDLAPAVAAALPDGARFAHPPRCSTCLAGWPAAARQFGAEEGRSMNGHRCSRRAA